MDVFDVFETAPVRGGATSPDGASPEGAPADDGAPPPAAEPGSGRGRTVAMAGVAAVAALVALVGGAFAVGKILLPDAGPSCSTAQVDAREQVSVWLQDTVNATTPDLGREVRPLGCGATDALDAASVSASTGVGAHAEIMDPPELERLRANLDARGCTLTDGLPATCTSFAGDVPLIVEVIEQPESAPGDYDVSVTVLPDATGT